MSEAMNVNHAQHLCGTRKTKALCIQTAEEVSVSSMEIVVTSSIMRTILVVITLSILLFVVLPVLTLQLSSGLEESRRASVFLQSKPLHEVFKCMYTESVIISPLGRWGLGGFWLFHDESYLICPKGFRTFFYSPSWEADWQSSFYSAPFIL